jgi:type I restriction-modification system DNA methylase subunit
MANGLTGLDQHQKRFIDAFQKLTYKHQSWQVWSDFNLMAACAISNRFDQARFEEREKMYMDRISRYDEKERQVFPELFAIVVEALDANPEQDFLGNLFMQLELGNHWKGQFFTPYNLCQVMAEMQTGKLQEMVAQKGYIGVNDPACGAGATLIAFAHAAMAKGINYQQQVLFVAQDIDQTAALMCYIQLSLLGCPGYVVIGDTLSQPVPKDPSSIWYTPLYFSEAWHMRRVVERTNSMFETNHAPLSAPVAKKSERVPKPRKRTAKEKPVQLTLF